MSIFKKKATDLTVGETIGLSLGLCVLGFIPYVIYGLAEGGYLNLKKEEKEPPKEITAEELETSD